MTDTAQGIGPDFKDPFKVKTLRRNSKMPKWLLCGRKPYKRVSPEGQPPSSTWYSANGVTFYNIYDLRAMIKNGRKKAMTHPGKGE